MKDDFTNIPNNAQCYTLNNASSISAYLNSTRDTYTQVGGKWYKSATSDYYTVPDHAICWSYNDITSLNSNAQFYPIFYTIGFLLAIFAFRFIWRIVRPLFKAHL